MEKLPFETKTLGPRVQSLSTTILRLLSEGRVESGEASSIHGQLNFAQGQYMGSPLKPAMQFF